MAVEGVGGIPGVLLCPFHRQLLEPVLSVTDKSHPAPHTTYIQDGPKGGNRPVWEDFQEHPGELAGQRKLK